MRASFMMLRETTSKSVPTQLCQVGIFITESIHTKCKFKTIVEGGLQRVIEDNFTVITYCESIYLVVEGYIHQLFAHFEDIL